MHYKEKAVLSSKMDCECMKAVLMAVFIAIQEVAVIR